MVLLKEHVCKYPSHYLAVGTGHTCTKTSQKEDFVMTQNQIRWQEHVENNRHNVTTERETLRSNLERERQGRVAQQEVNRSNRARERLTDYQNRETQRSNIARETETKRANLANEAIKISQQSMLNNYNISQLRESVRHNQAVERYNQTQQAISGFDALTRRRTSNSDAAYKSASAAIQAQANEINKGLLNVREQEMLLKQEANAITRARNDQLYTTTMQTLGAQVPLLHMQTALTAEQAKYYGINSTVNNIATTANAAANIVRAGTQVFQAASSARQALNSGSSYANYNFGGGNTIPSIY